jgi:hypothetical protein
MTGNGMAGAQGLIMYTRQYPNVALGYPLSIRPIYSCSIHSTFVHPYSNEINTTSTSISYIAIIKHTSIQKYLTFVTMVFRTVSPKYQRRDVQDVIAYW